VKTPPLHPESTQPTSRRVRLLALVIGVVILPLLLIMLLEGVSGFVFLARALKRGDPELAMRNQHQAQYDSELGWVSIPGFSEPDMYGPGAGLHIDSRGFRTGGKPDSRGALSGPLAVCSGDSFTFGPGVADDRTWCALLESLVPGLTAVNMGQNGYGLDQVYLWYKRDGTKLAHDVQLFAYITDDFRRMQRSTASGFAKPMLEIRNDSLVATNTPIPPYDAYTRRFWTGVVLESELRLVRLFYLVRDKLSRRMRPGSRSGDENAQDSLTWMKVRRIINELGQINTAKGSTLVLVHLPVIDDYWNADANPWRERMRAAAATGAFEFVDLVDELRRLPADSVQLMFLGDGIPGYADGVGHYSVAGNAWVADQLYRRLLEIPSFAAKLGRAHPDCYTSKPRRRGARCSAIPCRTC
jgi:hypothetical protein